MSPSLPNVRRFRAWNWIAAWVLLLSVVRADVVLVPVGSVWKYLDNGIVPGTAWRGADFDDSTWSAGQAPLGYGDGDEATTVGFGPNASAKYITTYFRTLFPVTDPSAITGLGLRVLRDDGVAVYLNGTEVFRNNLPTGTLSSTTLARTAISGAEESTAFVSATVDPGLLVPGDNVLAVEIHQRSATSSDISFDLELTGVTPGLPRVVRGPYLQQPTPDGMIVRWRTTVPTDSRVRFGATAAVLDQEVVVEGTRTEHAVPLSGLSANTAYFYAVGHTGGDLVGGEDCLFYTAPPAGAVQPIRFWVLGDAGTGMPGQFSVRDAFYQFAGTRYTDLILLLGDNAYDTGTDAEYQSKMFAVYPSIFRSTPSVSTVGNHDTAFQADPDVATTPYFQIFDHPTQGEGGGVPSGTEKYYSFNYGNIHFVCLDSMTSDRGVDSAMLMWLEQDLEQNTADWLIAFFHHPPYSKGSHNSDSLADSGGRMTEMRANALPILEAHGVDLVLSGHSHSYERSYLLDGHYGPSSTLTSAMKLDPGSGREGDTGPYLKASTGPLARSGVVYVVPGSAGDIEGGTLNHPAMFVSLNQLGSLVLDVDGTRLDAKFITSTGATNDHFTMLKEPLSNTAPKVHLMAPAKDATIWEGSPVALSAQAADSDGTVVAVAFYADGVLLGTDASEPYQFEWAGAPVGSHSLSAVAMDDDGASAESGTVTVTVRRLEPPAAPSGLTVTSPSRGTALLRWVENSDQETGFQIERSPDGIRWRPIATVGADATTFTNTKLGSGRTFHYRVRSLNSAGNSGYSNTASVVTR